MFLPRPTPWLPADPWRVLLLAMAALPGTDTETMPVIEEEESSDLDQPWHVIVFNDPVNLMSYVTMVIRRIFGYGRERAEQGIRTACGAPAKRWPDAAGHAPRKGFVVTRLCNDQ